MPDLQSFGYTEGAAADIVVPETTITAQVLEGQTVVADYTGPAALKFPAVLATLTPAQRAALMDQIAQQVVLMKAGY